VNKGMQTSDPDIYAAGDAVQVENFVLKTPAFIPMASPANKQGRIAADNIFGIQSEFKGTQGTAILKIFDMTAACTGINERDAIQNNIDYDKIYMLIPSNARYYPGWADILTKVIFRKTDGKILGAQLTGTIGVDKRCDVFATAIRFGACAEDLTELELSYAPPFGSPRDGSVSLIDVRNDMEAAPGSIEGFVRMPLEKLREEMHKLDKNKPVYVHCKSGMKSYVACRILSANGFDCYSLSGGYTIYNSVVKQTL